MVKIVVAWLIILSFLFSATNGKNHAHQSSRSQSPLRIPTVDLGELMHHSGEYKNHEVRVRAIYHSWFEGSEFSETANGWDGTGLVWVDFCDSFKLRSSPDVMRRLEEIKFRPQVERNSWYYDWQTEMIVTGKIYKSGKRKFGRHGGYKYAFVVASVEEIGRLKKFDGITLKYVKQ